MRVCNASSVPPLPKLSPRFAVCWRSLAADFSGDVKLDGVFPHVAIVSDRMKTAAAVGDVLRDALVAAGENGYRDYRWEKHREPAHRSNEKEISHGRVSWQTR